MASSSLGLGDGGDPDDVGPALDHDRLADRRGAARGRSSGGTAPSAARPSGARRWGRARSGSTARRSGGRPRGSRPCGRRGSARPRAARARRPPIPCTPVPCAHNRRAMDDTILSGDLRLSAHFAAPPHARRPASGSCSATGSRAARVARRRGHDLSRARRPASRDEAGWRRAHVQLPRHRHVRGRLLRRAAGSTTCVPRCASLDARDDVRGVWLAGFGHGGTFAVCEAADDHARAGCRDHRGAEHAARLGAGPRAPARARARRWA